MTSQLCFLLSSDQTRNVEIATNYDNSDRQTTDRWIYRVPRLALMKTHSQATAPVKIRSGAFSY